MNPSLLTMKFAPNIENLFKLYEAECFSHLERHPHSLEDVEDLRTRMHDTRKLLALCESPIERLFLIYWLEMGGAHPSPAGDPMFCKLDKDAKDCFVCDWPTKGVQDPLKEKNFDGYCTIIYPQYEIEFY